MEFNLFGRRFVMGIQEDPIILEEEGQSFDPNDQWVENIHAIERDLSDYGITEITESTLMASPKDIQKMLESDNTSMSQVMQALTTDYSMVETFKENDEMSKDPIVGSAMELMCDDSCLRNPTNQKMVFIDSENDSLSKFLNTFLEENVKIEDRLWEWCFEVVRDGDFKLRRREFESGAKGDKGRSVYYENVLSGAMVSRIEYMGQTVGFFDEEEKDNKGAIMPPDSFVHFMNTKSLRRHKIKVKVKYSSKDGDAEAQVREIECIKVFGTSLFDNARYIFRVVRLLDDMLIMSRVARSTQFNLVKIEVGNSSPNDTERIMNDVRRRFEGATRMTKGKGMRTDPSPIPINSNIYIPLREGKGDVVVDSINESVDVKFITDIEHFRNKEFATIKTPKAFLGFEEELPGSMGNTNLLKMDLRYARTVQRAQNCLKAGIRELCNNYLRFRGRGEEVNNFEVVMRDVTSIEDSSMIEDLISRVGLLDSLGRLAEENDGLIDKTKLVIYALNLIGIDVSQVLTDDLLAKMKNDDKVSDKDTGGDKGGNKGGSSDRKERLKNMKKIKDDEDIEDDDIKDSVIGG